MHPSHAIAQAREEERRALLPPLAYRMRGRSILDLEPLEPLDGEEECEDIAIDLDFVEDGAIDFDPASMVLVLELDAAEPPDLGEDVFDMLRAAVIRALAKAGAVAVMALAVSVEIPATIKAAEISSRAAAAQALLRLRLHTAHVCASARTLPAPIAARAHRAGW